MLSSATTPLSDAQGWAYFGSLHTLENYSVFTWVFVKRGNISNALVYNRFYLSSCFS